MLIDREEQQIRNAFSQIQVDTINLERKVLENMNTHNIIKQTKRTGFFAAASIAVFLFLSATVYAAATLGVFDRFITQHDPAFGEVVNPVEIYSVDQGIRIDVIAAQTFGNNAIMYLSVRDISGQNRITEYANLSWFIDIPRSEDRSIGVSSFSGFEPLYFNSETNTAYFQLEVQDAATIPNIFDLIINEVRFETRRTEMDFPIALSDISEAPTKPNPNYIPNRDFPTWCKEYILVPSMGENFPVLPGDGWISNVAIIDGNLHVQIMRPRFERTEYAGRNINGNIISGVTLTGPDGEYVAPINQSFIGLDANLEGLCAYEQQNMPPEDFLAWFEDAYSYDLMESVFPIDVAALDYYSLTLIGMFEHSVAGNWSMTVCTGETSEHMRSSTRVVTIDRAVIESVTVTPLGISFSGRVNGGINEGAASFRGRNVMIETPAGNVLVQEHPGIGFSDMYGEDATFVGFARAESPINISDVTAVVIGGVRIAIE